VGYDRGAHPAPVLAGDTLYAASRVLECREYNERAGIVSFQLIGLKNEKPLTLLSSGVNPFDEKHEKKVFEIERRILLPKRHVSG
jgi:2-methylfumaryl-CoA hydratase